MSLSSLLWIAKTDVGGHLLQMGRDVGPGAEKMWRSPARAYGLARMPFLKEAPACLQGRSVLTLSGCDLDAEVRATPPIP